jgi:hypothetical protein
VVASCGLNLAMANGIAYYYNISWLDMQKDSLHSKSPVSATTVVYLNKIEPHH